MREKWRDAVMESKESKEEKGRESAISHGSSRRIHDHA